MSARIVTIKLAFHLSTSCFSAGHFSDQNPPLPVLPVTDSLSSGVLSHLSYPLQSYQTSAGLLPANSIRRPAMASVTIKQKYQNII